MKPNFIHIYPYTCTRIFIFYTYTDYINYVIWFTFFRENDLKILPHQCMWFNGPDNAPDIDAVFLGGQTDIVSTSVPDRCTRIFFIHALGLRRTTFPKKKHFQISTKMPSKFKYINFSGLCRHIFLQNWSLLQLNNFMDSVKPKKPN